MALSILIVIAIVVAVLPTNYTAIVVRAITIWEAIAKTMNFCCRKDSKILSL